MREINVKSCSILRLKNYEPERRDSGTSARWASASKVGLIESISKDSGKESDERDELTTGNIGPRNGRRLAEFNFGAQTLTASGKLKLKPASNLVMNENCMTGNHDR